ncbi:hypothetical protein Acsp03_39520 [Actinomadura sp. NBRC 104412]|nr:hypothetical protein Acsp03_39520 [Actinomadura sp. NBRC 104412]
MPANARVWVPDHWHVGTSRDGTWRVLPERRDRAGARAMVRALLVRDGELTGDHRYEAGVRAIDRGYDSYLVGLVAYVAFACMCPEPSTRKGQDSGHAGVVSPVGVPEGFAVRDAESDRVRGGGEGPGVCGRS